MAQKDSCSAGGEYLVGIDFGACNIKAGVFTGSKFKALKLNTNDGDAKECPNFLLYKKNQDGALEQVLGNLARKQLPHSPENVLSGIKRKLEESSWHGYIPALDREIDAIQGATDIFAQLKQKFHPAREEALAAVITVPVSFSNIQIGRLRKAAENAGIAVKAIISESFAAMFAIDRLEDLEDGLHVVFDFGGSTLDVSVFSIAHGGAGLEIRELSACGMRLGGLDIDNLICDMMLARGHYKELSKQYGEYNETTVRQLLLLNSEDWKKDLFGGMEDEVCLSVEPEIYLRQEDINPVLEGGEFRGRIMAMLDSVFAELEDGMEYHSKGEVVKVWPCGGTCRIPCFTRMLEEYFSPEIFNADEFDPEDTDLYIRGMEDNYHAVAAGAVRWHELRKNGHLAISSSLPFHVGILKDGLFKVCLEKNSPAGLESPAIQLPLEWLEQNGWIVPIYQKFATGDNTDPIYMGHARLDKSLYDEGEFPILGLNMTAEGDLAIHIYQRQLCGDGQEYDIIPIEDFIIGKGCGNEPE